MATFDCPNSDGGNCYAPEATVAIFHGEISIVSNTVAEMIGSTRTDPMLLSEDFQTIMTSAYDFVSTHRGTTQLTGDFMRQHPQLAGQDGVIATCSCGDTWVV